MFLEFEFEVLERFIPCSERRLISDEHICKKAAVELGIAYATSGSYDYLPRGCVKQNSDSGAKIFFNTHNIGAANSFAVCYKLGNFEFLIYIYLLTF